LVVSGAVTIEVPALDGDPDGLVCILERGL
jgi:hypothetical protein